MDRKPATKKKRVVLLEFTLVSDREERDIQVIYVVRISEAWRSSILGKCVVSLSSHHVLGALSERLVG